MDAWLTNARARLAAASGVPLDELELDDATVETLLDLARVAAHESGDRRNAPLLCYLVGVASRNAALETLSTAARAAD